MWFLLTAVHALGATPVEIPAGEDPAAWATTLALADLAIGVVPEEGASVRIEAGDGRWILHVRDAAGAERSATIERPADQAAREDCAWLLASLLTAVAAPAPSPPPPPEPRAPQAPVPAVPPEPVPAAAAPALPLAGATAEEEPPVAAAPAAREPAHPRTLAVAQAAGGVTLGVSSELAARAELDLGVARGPFEVLALASATTAGELRGAAQLGLAPVPPLAATVGVGVDSRPGREGVAPVLLAGCAGRMPLADRAWLGLVARGWIDLDASEPPAENTGLDLLIAIGLGTRDRFGRSRAWRGR